MRRFAVLVALALPAAAAADVGVREVAPSTARPGESVRITVRGFLGPQPWPRMPVVLVAAGRAPHPYPCRGGGLCAPSVYVSDLSRPPYRLLGSVARWRPLGGAGASAVGVLNVRIPRVRSGRYLLGLFCASCTRGPKGSVIIDRRLVLTIRS